MAFEYDCQHYTGIAAQAALATQHLAVKFASTANRVKALGASTDTACGVLRNVCSAAGDEALVAYEGVVKMVAGTSAGFTNGAQVGYDSTGRAQPTYAKKVGTYIAYGESVAIGTIVSIRLHPGLS